MRGDMLKRESGFTLIEIIVALVLAGILSIFVGLFMNTFFDGYFLVKNNSETALKAQLALDRMSVELKGVSSISSLTDNSQITYANSSGANKVIKYVGTNIYLSTLTNNVLIDNVLIDGVSAFQLNATYNNVYNVAADDLAFIDIGFTVTGYIPSSFNTRIFPRSRVVHP